MRVKTPDSRGTDLARSPAGIAWDPSVQAAPPAAAAFGLRRLGRCPCDPCSPWRQRIETETEWTRSPTQNRLERFHLNCVPRHTLTDRKTHGSAIGDRLLF